MADKIYCGSGRIVTGKFGQIIKISLSKEDINKIVSYMNQNGSEWANLEMKEKQNPVAGKPTHYLQIDDWKPEAKQAEQAPVRTESVESDDDSLPF